MTTTHYYLILNGRTISDSPDLSYIKEVQSKLGGDIATETRNTENMNTIKERAKHKAEISQFRSDYIYDRYSVEFGYIEGAEEQKTIDDKELQDYVGMTCKEVKQVMIDKACEWLSVNLPITSQDDIDKQALKVITKENLQEILKDFRKAIQQ